MSSKQMIARPHMDFVESKRKAFGYREGLAAQHRHNDNDLLLRAVYQTISSHYCAQTNYHNFFSMEISSSWRALCNSIAIL